MKRIPAHIVAEQVRILRKPHGRIPARADYDHPYLAEDEIDRYAEALFRIAQIVFQTRQMKRKPFLPPGRRRSRRFGDLDVP
jgi:hypothetical protein